jgi:type VI secretion system protein ImpL
MQRFWKFLTTTRNLRTLGLFALLCVLLIGADALDLSNWWVIAVLVVLGLLALFVWWVKRRMAQQAGEQLERAVGFGASALIMSEPNKDKREAMKAVREEMRQALRTIKTSKLGMRSGSAALYELPWYAIIGNPAAGKSSAVIRSGLNFPFPHKSNSATCL